MPSPELEVLIVDDEAPARAALRHRLSAAEGVTVLGEASGGRAALEAVAELEPDVVFLDIEMPDGDGFAVAAGLPGEDPPHVVFVTAYDQYAVEAFESHALDYLLKPVSQERLADALARVRRRMREERDAAEHRRLLSRLEDLRGELDGEHPPPARRGGEPAGGIGDGGLGGRLVVKRRGEFTLVPLEDVRWLEAAGNYVRIHTDDDAFLHRSTLAELEDRLPGDAFARVHRSAIVSLDRVQRVVPTDAGDFEVHLDRGDVVRMSRSHRDRLLE